MLRHSQAETITFLTPFYVPEVIYLCKLTQFAHFQILFAESFASVGQKSFVWRRRVAPPRKPFSYDNRTGLHLNSKSLRCNLEMGFSLKNSAYWLWCVWRCGENIKWNLYHRSQQLQKVQSSWTLNMRSHTWVILLTFYRGFWEFTPKIGNWTTKEESRTKR